MSDWWEMADWYERELEVLTDTINMVGGGSLSTSGEGAPPLDDWLAEDIRRREVLPARIAACRAQAEAADARRAATECSA